MVSNDDGTLGVELATIALLTELPAYPGDAACALRTIKGQLGLLQRRQAAIAPGGTDCGFLTGLAEATRIVDRLLAHYEPR